MTDTVVIYNRGRGAYLWRAEGRYLLALRERCVYHWIFLSEGEFRGGRSLVRSSEESTGSGAVVSTLSSTNTDGGELSVVLIKCALRGMFDGSQ